MLVAERVLLKLLTEFRDKTDALKGARPIPPDLDTVAFAILSLVSEYAPQLTHHEEILELLDQCEASIADDNPPMPLSYRQADSFPFTLARALINQDFVTLTGENDTFDLLSHRNSTIRWHCYNIVWFAKEQIEPQVILPALFKNIADTLGYVEEAVGLARSVFKTDQEFFASAGNATPPPHFAEQYQERLKRFREGNTLQNCQDIFMKLELRVKAKIAKTALSLEIPEKTAAVQLELPVGKTVKW
jgi:hypothetical protein